MLTALNTLDEHGRTASEAALMLFHRLAALAPESPEQADQIHELAQRWSTNADHGTAEAISNLISSTRSPGFNPEAYQDRLMSLLDEAQCHTDLASDSDLADPSMVREHALEVAAALLETDLPSDLERIPALRSLCGSAEALLELGRLDLLDQAACFADKLVLRGMSTPAQSEVDELRLRLRNREVLEACALKFAHGGAHADSAESLLVRAAPETSAVIIDHCLSDLGGMRRLASVGRNADAKGFHDAICSRAQSNPDLITALRPLLQELPSQTVLEALQPGCSHEDREIRRLAFASAAELLSTWPTPLLYDALTDSDESIHAIALRYIAEDQTENSAALLSRYLGGRLHTRPTAHTIQPAIETLASLPADMAVNYLAAALDALRTGVVSATSDAAYLLAQSLEKHAGDPVAEKSLRAWKLSPPACSAN